MHSHIVFINAWISLQLYITCIYINYSGYVNLHVADTTCQKVFLFFFAFPIWFILQKKENLVLFRYKTTRLYDEGKVINTLLVTLIHKPQTNTVIFFLIQHVTLYQNRFFIRQCNYGYSTSNGKFVFNCLFQQPRYNTFYCILY